ncbi:MAG: histidine kinase dimerization/phosphoacceptor domain -containing protein [Bacteroidota bacterium]|nr:histidine kinase dimerization/phosphoacceptor domain -containing protein [Bacteroidota bacterium]
MSDIKEINLLEELDSISKIHFLHREDIDAIMTDFAKHLCVCLKMERMSVWLYNQDHSALISIGEYDTRYEKFSKNTILLEKDYPVYFKAIIANEIIIAEDIYTHPLTKELTTNYSKPNDIYSLLDIPLRISGELVGVMCYEKTGVAKTFTKDEINFCLSVSFVLASNLESRKRRATQEKLEKALQEKDLLLKEINHRVKNNFSILISLMRLRKARVNNVESKALLEEYEQRIFSMLKIHDMLEKNNLYSKLSLSDYIKELIVEFRVTYPQINKNCKIEINHLDFLISTKKAIHLGLIVSEILLNAIKHSDFKKDGFEMIVSLKKLTENDIELKIGDNGKGFDFEKEIAKNTLGLALIKDLADSLELIAKYPTNNNCYYTFNFKM